MKIFFLAIILALFIASGAFAQHIELSGKIVDMEQSAVEFVNVIVLNNGVFVEAAVTDSLGRFKFEMNKGNYTLCVEQFGQELLKKEIALNDNTDLGIISIDESVMLDAITIISRKKLIERKSDRLVFNIENAVSATGGDVMDLLKVTPGLRVQNETVSMVGKNSMSVMVNGHLMQLAGDDLVNFLKTIESKDVKSVEVMSNPPAKYSAEGNSGLVNIVLKKTEKDYLGGTIRGTYQRSLKDKGYFGGDITYQKDRLSLFASTTIGRGSSERTENMKVFYPNQFWNLNSNQDIYTKLVSGRIGIDYDISKEMAVGIQYLGNRNRPDLEEKNQTDIYNRISSSIDSLIVTDGDTDTKQFYHSLNAHFKSKLDSLGKAISIDVDYFKYGDNSGRVNKSLTFIPGEEMTERYIDMLKATSIQNIEALTAAIDINFPMKNIEIAFGGKMSILQNESENRTFNFVDDNFLLSADESDSFLYKENTQAVYINANKTLGKWDFQAGLRFESTQTTGNSNTMKQSNRNHYEELFPTVYVVYKPNDDHVITLNYGKRINRPNYQRLNPFKWYSNPYSYSEGNPFLLPSFTQNIELTHTLKNNLNSTFYFSKTTDGAEQLTLVDANSNLQATVWRNFVKSYSVGMTESYQIDFTSWLESYFQANVAYLKVKSTLPNTISSKSGVNFDFSINNTFYFNKEKTFLGELNYWYDSSGISSVYDVSASGSLDLAIKLSILDKSLDFGFVFMDVLKTNISTVKGMSNGLNVEYRNYYDTRQIRFSVVYRLGNKKFKSKRQSFSNDEERGRLN